MALILLDCFVGLLLFLKLVGVRSQQYPINRERSVQGGKGMVLHVLLSTNFTFKVIMKGLWKEGIVTFKVDKKFLNFKICVNCKIINKSKNKNK